MEAYMTESLARKTAIIYGGGGGIGVACDMDQPRATTTDNTRETAS